MFQFHPYFIPMLISTVITGCIALFALRRRKVRGALAFSVIMFLLFIWSLFYMLEVGVSDFALQRLFLRLQYLAIPFLPVAILYFVLEYGGYNRFLNMKAFGLLLIPPVVFFILLITNDFHHLFFIREYTVLVGDLHIRGFVAGPGYILTTLYNIILLLISAAFLIQIYLSSTGIHKLQTGILIGALAAPAIVGFLYHMGITPYPFLDITAVMFPICGICVLVGLFRYRFFDIVPMPKRVLFSSLTEGVLVLDDKKRIIDINSAARSILGKYIEADGSVISDKDTFLNDYMEELDSKAELAFLAEVGRDGETKYYAVSVTPVTTYPDDPEYRIVVLRDITSEKNSEAELQKSRTSLRIANEKISLLNSITRHDILNNITVLSAYTDMLREDLPPDCDGMVYLEKIRKAIDMISRQIRFTADYQNMGIGEPIWQDIRPLILNTWDSIEQAKRDIRFNVDLPRGLEIYADMLLSKVFYNLFENSIRHGGEVTAISVSFKEMPDGTGVLIVADDGTGIPENSKNEIFSKGFGKNTGLGLFLVSEILSITQIEIFETGKEGDGARFEMMIPPKGWRMRGE